MSAEIISGLAALTDEDLAAVAGKLSLKRARGEEEKAPEQFTQDEGVVVVWWDATCTFPSAALAASRCSCPARRPCRHRVRSVRWLRRHAVAPAAQEGFPALDLAAFRGAATPAEWRDAGLAARDFGVATTGPRVVIPALAVRLRFGGPALEDVFCSCGAPQPCAHALLVAAGQEGNGQEIGPTADPSAVLALAGELVLAGLDGTPAARGEELRALAVDLRVALPGPAADLEALAAQLTRYHRRSARYAPEAWMRILGRLFARCVGLSAAEPPVARRRLRGVLRRRMTRCGPLELVGLGGEGFAGQGALIRVFLADTTTGQILSVSTGRGEEAGLSPQALWRAAPLLGSLPAEAVADRRLRLLDGRRSAAGTLSTAASVRALTLGPAALDAVPPACRCPTLADLVARLRGLPPPLLRELGGDDVMVVLDLHGDPWSGPVARDPITGALWRTVRLASGDPLALMVPSHARPAVRAAFVSMGAATTTRGLLVRAWCGPLGVQATPLSAWNGADAPVSLGFEAGPAPPVDPSEVVERPGAAAAAEGALGALDGLIAELHGLGGDGLARAAWRGPALRRHAAALAALDLDHGAAAAARLAAAVHSGPTMSEIPGFVALLAWALSLREVAVLAECSPGPPTAAA